MISLEYPPPVHPGTPQLSLVQCDCHLLLCLYKAGFKWTVQGLSLHAVLTSVLQSHCCIIRCLDYLLDVLGHELPECMV